MVVTLKNGSVLQLEDFEFGALFLKFFRNQFIRHLKPEKSMKKEESAHRYAVKGKREREREE